MPAAEVVKSILNQRHGSIPDFQIVIPIELLRQRQKTQSIFNVVMGAIASISLLVGGIGIMNIMLATVTSTLARSAFGAASAPSAAISSASSWSSVW